MMLLCGVFFTCRDAQAAHVASIESLLTTKTTPKTRPRETLLKHSSAPKATFPILMPAHANLNLVRALDNDHNACPRASNPNNQRLFLYPTILASCAALSRPSSGYSACVYIGLAVSNRSCGIGTVPTGVVFRSLVLDGGTRGYSDRGHTGR
jgi:hypothetical protein